jgi:transcriptional regulator with XRE-family HTH domain
MGVRLAHMQNESWPRRAENGFIDRMREVRQVRGVSQAKLAQCLRRWGLDLHQSSIAKLETADHAERRPLRLSEALAIADVLGEDLRYMIQGPLGEEAERAEMLRLRSKDLSEEAGRVRSELSGLQERRWVMDNPVAGGGDGRPWADPEGPPGAN